MDGTEGGSVRDLHWGRARLGLLNRGEGERADGAVVIASSSGNGMSSASAISAHVRIGQVTVLSFRDRHLFRHRSLSHTIEVPPPQHVRPRSEFGSGLPSSSPTRPVRNGAVAAGLPHFDLRSGNCRFPDGRRRARYHGRQQFQ